MKIMELYPCSLFRTAIEDEATGKWSAALVEWKDNSPGETIFAFENYIYDTSEEALLNLNALLAIIKAHYICMSN